MQRLRPLPVHRQCAPALPLAVLVAATLAGCSSVDGFMSADKVDYRTTASTTRAAGLEVPPDLSQLARETRYQLPAGGVVSASTLRPGATGAVATGAAPATTGPSTAVQQVGNVTLQREGQTRWIATPEAPQVVLPKVRAFWLEQGFTIASEDVAAGTLETEWAENRAKLPHDIIRRTVGKLFESAYSTGELDRFRVRVERSAQGGSEVYVAHRGVVEVSSGPRNDQTTWTSRAADPMLEAEMLSRLMLKLGAPQAQAQAVAQGVPATLPAGQPARPTVAPLPDRAELQIAAPFDRAWRQVGLALDRSGFTVEDRDRSAGLYFVRYVDPRTLEQGEGNFITRWLRSSSTIAPVRYRVLLKANAAGTATDVSVLDANGQPDASEPARTIAARMIDALR